MLLLGCTPAAGDFYDASRAAGCARTRECDPDFFAAEFESTRQCEDEGEERFRAYTECVPAWCTYDPDQAALCLDSLRHDSCGAVMGPPGPLACLAVFPACDQEAYAACLATFMD